MPQRLSNKWIILIVVVIIAVIAVIVVFATQDNSEDVGDFSIIYGSSGIEKKYGSVVRQGVARWSNKVNGNYTIYLNTKEQSSSVIASTSGNSIYLNPSVFDNATKNHKVLTVAHEVGHVLGLGVNWSSNRTSSEGYVVLSPTAYPKTAASYKSIISNKLSGPPLEEGGGPGTQYSHWSSLSSLGLSSDIMVGVIRSSSDNISIVDLTYLEELGKSVNKENADPLSGVLRLTVEYFVNDKTEHCCGNCKNNN